MNKIYLLFLSLCSSIFSDNFFQQKSLNTIADHSYGGVGNVSWPVEPYQKDIKCSDGDIIFLFGEWMDYFLEDCRNIDSDYILIMNHADRPLRKSDWEIINTNHLIHCFATNCSFIDEKITLIPIGFEDDKCFAMRTSEDINVFYNFYANKGFRKKTNMFMRILV